MITGFATHLFPDVGADVVGFFFFYYHFLTIGYSYSIYLVCILPDCSFVLFFSACGMRERRERERNYKIFYCTSFQNLKKIM